MSQQEVKEYLKRCEKPKTPKELAEVLDCNRHSINRNLRKLRESDPEVKFINTRSKKYNHRIKAYFV